MKPHYSIAICPPYETVSFVRGIKKELEKEIGRYPSRNSEGHITFNVFEADENELKEWEEHVTQFCKKIIPFEIRLASLCSYKNGAFYFSPDKPSKKHLIQVMKEFNKIPLVVPGDNDPDPHMSIARQLSDDQLKKAFELFRHRMFDIKFNCHDLAIRKFNPKVGQYEIYKRVELTGKPNPILQ